MRLRVVCTENLPKSEVIHLRPSLSATDTVVPDPQKKSAIMSPLFDDASITRSNNDSGFCVGYPIFSFACEFTGKISVQISSTG